MISLNKDQQGQMLGKLQRYFSSELDQDLGGFEAQFLLDFIAKDLGAYFYNQGLADALKHVETRFEDISESMYELIQDTDSMAKL
ncbi:MAG: hypothetical protein COC19_03505 [SAR86 cluster bacterium]|uniref:DUF2164 domain-containing protein n=1 Tax=SAR86 cluster bacterium TaxID=2030880 RepID=A0A2A4MQ68_9GAMM|nr:MAG: hypothetical protein COC19_03505 [SAR86 cluster bacterium]